MLSAAARSCEPARLRPAAGLDEERVATLSRRPTSPLFGPTERAGLAFTEQFVIDVAGLDDATAGAVRDALGEQGLVDFVTRCSWSSSANACG